MEASEEFKWALKVVIKRQMRDLIEQLRENGEEIAILSADLDSSSCSHFGSPKGEWFMSEQRNLSASFLNFCRKKTNKRMSVFEGMGLSQSSNHEENEGHRHTAGLNQSGSDDSVVKVSVPAKLAEDMTEEQLAGLVGRLVVAKLTGSLQPGNMPWKKESGLKTRSGRGVSRSFKTTLDNLKKPKDRDRMDSKSDLISELIEIKEDDLHRFKVFTESGRNVDLQSVTSSVQQLELIAEDVVQAVDDFLTSHSLLTDRVKVVVSCCNADDKVSVELETPAAGEAGHGSMDVDLEASDREDLAGEDDVEDPDFLPPKHHKPVNSFAKRYELDTPSGMNTKLLSLQGRKVVSSEVSNVSGIPQKALSLRVGMKLKKIKKKQTRRYDKHADCPYCGITIAGAYNLPGHIKRVHLKIRNHKCTICKKEFFSSTSLETHMINVHTRRCESCKEYVVESVPWMEGITAKTPREVTCVCGAPVVIVTRKGWKQMQFVTGDEDDENQLESKLAKEKQNYACGVCGRLYATQRDCERHALSHSTKKTFICEVCGSGFKERQVLVAHMYKEHGVYSNKCELCSKNFASKTSLKVHMSKAHPKGTSSSTLGQLQPAAVEPHPREQKVSVSTEGIEKLITSEILVVQSSEQQ